MTNTGNRVLLKPARAQGPQRQCSDIDMTLQKHFICTIAMHDVVAILCLIAMPNYSPRNYSLPMYSSRLLHSTLELSHHMIRLLSINQFVFTSALHNVRNTRS